MQTKAKLFVGETMEEVLRDIQKEFRPDYEILYKKTIGGGLKFWQKKEVHVKILGRPLRSEEPARAFEPASPSPKSPSGEEANKKAILQMLEAKAAPMPEKPKAYASPKAALSAPAPTPAPAAPEAIQAPFAEASSPQETMDALRRMVSASGAEERSNPGGGDVRQMLEKLVTQVETKTKGFLEEESDEVLKHYYDRLIETEVDKKIAQRLFMNLKKEIGEDDLMNKLAVERALVKKMEAVLKTTGPFDPSVKTLAFIGPTGVGKTTTLAKIAGILRSRNKRIGLITTDVFRIGATDQLQIYANILDSKMIAATTPEELKEAIDYFRNAQKVDHILIDTVGRSPMNPELLDEIKTYIDIAKPDHTGLVLSSTQKYSDILKILSNFDRISIDSVIFTKLDETLTHGVMMNVAARGKYKISYITDGQNVPQDIYSATSEGLAQKILNGVSEFGSSLVTA